MLRFLMNELLTQLMLIRIYIIPILDAVKTAILCAGSSCLEF